MQPNEEPRVVYTVKFPHPANPPATVEIQVYGDLRQVLATAAKLPVPTAVKPGPAWEEYPEAAGQAPGPAPRPQPSQAPIGHDHEPEPVPDVPHCPTCGSPATWREGTRKSDGRPYKFWKCLACDKILSAKKSA